MPFASDVVNTATSRTMDALDVNGEIRERIPFSGPRKKGLASLNIQKAQKDEDEETDGAFLLQSKLKMPGFNLPSSSDDDET
jgi:hypothetical protein